MLFIDYSMLIVLIVGTVFAVFWLYLFWSAGDRYDEMIGALNAKEYQLRDLFAVGFRFMDLIHFNMHSEIMRKKRKEMEEIRDKKYAPFYLYILIGSMFAYSLTLLPIVFIVAALAGDLIVLAGGILIGGLIIRYLYDTVEDKIKERRDALISEFPNVLTKLTLLVNSGMVLRNAWMRVTQSGEGPIYTEMQKTTDDMNNGVSEIEAYHDFAERCSLKEMRKFAAMVSQGIEKGGAELTFFLKDMSDELWEEKKSLAKQKGEKAASKLLIPTALIFMGILAMIMVPIVSGLSF